MWHCTGPGTPTPAFRRWPPTDPEQRAGRSAVFAQVSHAELPNPPGARDGAVCGTAPGVSDQFSHVLAAVMIAATAGSEILRWVEMA